MWNNLKKINLHTKLKWSATRANALILPRKSNELKINAFRMISSSFVRHSNFMCAFNEFTFFIYNFYFQFTNSVLFDSIIKSCPIHDTFLKHGSAWLFVETFDENSRKKRVDVAMEFNKREKKPDQMVVTRLLCSTAKIKTPAASTAVAYCTKETMYLVGSGLFVWDRRFCLFTSTL